MHVAEGINRLPIELLAHILDFVAMDRDRPRRVTALSRAALMNRQWRALAEERLWRHVDLLTVLRLLPGDAWSIINRFNSERQLLPEDFGADPYSAPEEWKHRIPYWPELNMRRTIKESEWEALLPCTRLIKYISTDALKDGAEEITAATTTTEIDAEQPKVQARSAQNRAEGDKTQAEPARRLPCIDLHESVFDRLVSSLVHLPSSPLFPCLRVLEVGALPKGRGHVMRLFSSPVLEEIKISGNSNPADVEEGLEALLAAEPALGEKLQRLQTPPVSERLLPRFKNVHFVVRPKRAVSWEA
ncbi:hypothetical protein BD626DRAFT_607670 [Schizophyllum amplum]|uniref:F-box domain-containing protein n=1 Tax=Schizophyllum amplum TaxID=97359 RepID=A0A550C4N9_9AGAR|nr:hypothetical protein BD626DRAFT_607670 [Auriculariopsis ampla]